MTTATTALEEIIDIRSEWHNKKWAPSFSHISIKYLPILKYLSPNILCSRFAIACPSQYWRSRRGLKCETYVKCSPLPMMQVYRVGPTGDKAYLMASSWSVTSLVPSWRCTVCRKSSPRPLEPRPSTDVTITWFSTEPNHVLQSIMKRSVTSCVPSDGELNILLNVHFIQFIDQLVFFLEVQLVSIIETDS